MLKFLSPLLFFVAFWSTSVLAQQGGKNVFSFLNLPTGARITGLGGYASAVADNTLDFGIYNPSLVSEPMDGSFSVQQCLLPSGINFGSFATAFKTKKGLILPYLRYVNYGTFQGYDPTGNQTNTFGALDYQVGFSYSFPMNKYFRLGVNSGIIGSHLESYSSYGVSGSFAVQFQHPNELLHATLLARNIGIQAKGYTSGNAFNPLPIEIQSSVSLKLKHAPLRFTAIAHHLNQWKIGYFDPSIPPSIDALTGDTIPPPSIGFVEQLGRHLAIQMELVTKGVFQLRLGFDFQRRQELKLEQIPGISGMSLGVGLHFRKLKIDYGFMFFSKAGISNSIGLSTKFGDWKKN
ncbi:MAG: type IX secretion system protein PorQ [Flavobacteriales bacterium]